MPTYEYRCKDCGEHLEVVQSFTDDALTVCPNCSGSLRKVFGNIGVTFKGSGFYRNDSRSASKVKAKKDSAEKSDSSSDSSSDTSSEKSGASEKTGTAEKPAAPDKSDSSSSKGDSSSKSEAKTA